MVPTKVCVPGCMRYYRYDLCGLTYDSVFPTVYDLCGLTYEQMEVLATNTAFIFPQMLPEYSFVPNDVPLSRGRVIFSSAEDS